MDGDGACAGGGGEERHTCNEPTPKLDFVDFAASPSS